MHSEYHCRPAHTVPVQSPYDFDLQFKPSLVSLWGVNPMLISKRIFLFFYRSPHHRLLRSVYISTIKQEFVPSIPHRFGRSGRRDTWSRRLRRRGFLLHSNRSRRFWRRSLLTETCSPQPLRQILRNCTTTRRPPRGHPLLGRHHLPSNPSLPLLFFRIAYTPRI